MFDLPFTPSNWRKTARFQSTDAFATRFAKLSLLQNFVYPLEVAANKKKTPATSSVVRDSSVRQKFRIGRKGK